MMRDLIGYAANRPQFLWPGEKRVALNFVINYEEGAELSPINGDSIAECYGGEFLLQQGKQGQRDLSIESLYEFGARSGVWRLLEIFESRNIPLTFFATGFALSLNPEISDYLKQSSHEIAGHGWRWINYKNIDKKTEKQHIIQTKEFIEKRLKKPMHGWYSGRASINTRSLLLDIGGVIYDSDSYCDDLPFYFHNTQHLIIPYTLDCNDFRFTTSPGFSSSEDFFNHLKNALDYCCSQKTPQLISIGLHPRLSGRASRLGALIKFLDYLNQNNNVWLASRIQIANFFISKKT